MKNLLKVSALFLALGLTSCGSQDANSKAGAGAGGPPVETNTAGTDMAADTMAIGSMSPADATTTDPNAPSTGTSTDPSATMSERKDAKSQ